MEDDSKSAQIKNEAVERAIKSVGSQEIVAKRLGVSQTAVGKWLWRSCPAKRAVQLEELSGVSRSEIRPDIFRLNEKK